MTTSDTADRQRFMRPACETVAASPGPWADRPTRHEGGMNLREKALMAALPRECLKCHADNIFRVIDAPSGSQGREQI